MFTFKGQKRLFLVRNVYSIRQITQKFVPRIYFILLI